MIHSTSRRPESILSNLDKTGPIYSSGSNSVRSGISGPHLLDHSGNGQSVREACLEREVGLKGSNASSDGDIPDWYGDGQVLARDINN